jgi:hypothetical protein
MQHCVFQGTGASTPSGDWQMVLVANLGVDNAVRDGPGPGRFCILSVLTLCTAVVLGWSMVMFERVSGGAFLMVVVPFSRFLIA